MRVTPEIDFGHIVICVGVELLSNSAMTSDHSRIKSGFPKHRALADRATGVAGQAIVWDPDLRAIGFERSGDLGCSNSRSLAASAPRAMPNRFNSNHAAASEGRRL